MPGEGSAGDFTPAGAVQRLPPAVVQLPTLLRAMPTVRTPCAAHARDMDDCLAPLTVLVADDAAPVAALLSELLTEAGARVVGTAADGEQALRLFEQAAPDAVVLDIEMPRVNGLEVLKAIRARPGGRRPLVIVMTTHGEPALRDMCLAAGADHFLEKGSEFERLLDIVPAYTASCAARVSKVTTAPEKLPTVSSP